MVIVVFVFSCFWVLVSNFLFLRFLVSCLSVVWACFLFKLDYVVVFWFGLCFSLVLRIRVVIWWFW